MVLDRDGIGLLLGASKWYLHGGRHRSIGYYQRDLDRTW